MDWAQCDSVCFHIDSSRSTGAAKVLFGDTTGPMVRVCDRDSAYQRLAKDLGGQLILQGCWVHQQRDVMAGATGRKALHDWLEAWLARFAVIFQLNQQRLNHYNPCSNQQTALFQAAHAELVQACDDLFAQAERESAGLEEDSPRRQPLRSLLEPREGLCVFLDQPAVPLTNNAAERVLRLRVILRRLTFGSDSELGARTIAIRHSVFGTLKMNRIEVLPWLTAWLTACAAHGGSAPSELSAWLPGSMSPAQR